MLPAPLRRARWICLVSVCLTGVAVAESPPPKHTLRYQFSPNAVLQYTVGNESTIDVQVGTTAETVAHSSESGRLLRTVAVHPDGSADLEILIEYVNLSAGDGISWDSRSGDPPPPEFQGIDQTIGKPLMKITVAPTGAVIAAESNGKMADQAQLQNAQFDLFPLLPADAIAVGGSWTEPFHVDILSAANLPKQISLQRAYTLRAVSGGVAEIDVQTSVLTPLDDPLEEGQLIQRTSTGTVRIDIAQGRLLERVLQLDNKVVGFKGPQTAVRVVGTRQESLESSDKTAARSTERQTQ